MRNKAILKRAFSVVANYGSPWLIAGGLNTVPETILAQCAISLERTNGYVVATSDPTHCPSTGTHRTIDFAICSQHLCDWVQDMRVDLASKPRRMEQSGCLSKPPRTIT